MPKLPKYKDKNGRYVLGLDNNKIHITDGFIRFSFKPLKTLNCKFKTNINEYNKLIQCRFIPNGSNYVMEIVYEINAPDIHGEPTNIMSIDLGISNFATIVNNIGLQPIAIKGGNIKSINQYYNKQKAKIQSELMLKNKKNWSDKLRKLTDKRNNKIKNWTHTASKYIVDYAVLYGIDTIVCGYNQTWKQEPVMNKKVNQGFINIPYDMFIKQLIYKCENNGIRFILTEETYTSGTSFIDGEHPTQGNYNKSRRVTRGLFRSDTGIFINADVNGSYQIMKKVFPNAFAEGIEGVGLHPLCTKVA